MSKMMKIIFIIPPSIHYIEPYAYIEADKNNTERPSLGLLYVAAAAKPLTGVDIRIIDANVDKLTLNDIDKMIAEETPDIVGFSVLTFNLLNCMAVSKIVRKCSPKTKICFGGWHPTLYPRETLSFGFVDYLVVGEGEWTFRELVQVSLRKGSTLGKSLENIKGLGYKTEDGNIVINAPREVVINLDDFPFPAYDLVDVTKYSHLLADSGQIMSIMTSRGCPQKCIFCDVRKTRYRYRSPSGILEEMKYWVEQGVNEFYIQDDNFAINRKRTIELCRLLINEDMDIKYKISSRVDYIDDEIAEYLKKSGCNMIVFGVESGCQRILNYLQKGITTQETKKAFQSAHKFGIGCGANIIIGVPSETRQDMDMTMNLIKEIKPDHFHCSICTPMPKTYLYNKLMLEGLIKEDYWLDFAKNPEPSFKTPFASQVFTGEELRGIQNAIQKQFYFNPRIVLREILMTGNFKQFISKARIALKILFN